MRAALLMILLLLSACVVHSNAPLFSEAEAVAVLGTRPVTVTLTPTDPDTPFRALPARLDLVPQGNHYRVTSAKGPTDLAFIPLGPGLYALQYGVPTGQDYALATLDGTRGDDARGDGARLVVAPLDCGRLKTDLRSNLLLIFVTSSCQLVTGTDVRAAFASFAAVGPKARLVMQAE